MSIEAITNIDPKNLIILRKWSALEWYAIKQGLSEEQTLKSYQESGIDSKPIVTAHQTQLGSLNNLLDLLPSKPEVISGDDDINHKLFKPETIVFVLGGDNYFQNVSHFLDNQPVLFINSDAERSSGALAAFDHTQIETEIKKILNGEYLIEEWTRLEAEIAHGGEPKIVYHLALSEILVADNEPDQMTKYQMEFEGQTQRYNDSGLIIATGRGSTGWFDSAIRYIKPEGFQFDPVLKQAAFISREFFPKKTAQEATRFATFGTGDELLIHYLGYSPGRVSIDSKVRHNIEMGDKVRIKIGSQPLRVIRTVI